jgi:F-type H+-transporting ATPase subunit b
MRAWAADAAHGAAPFYTTAEFWVFVGFVIFVALVFRTVSRVVSVALDERARKIKSQIDEAARLAEEAQQLLATYERKQREAQEEAAMIVDQAQHEAQRLAARAEEELARSLKRREELALERIAQAEASALADVRGLAVDVAIEASQKLLKERLTAKQATGLIDAAIAGLSGRLH